MARQQSSSWAALAMLALFLLPRAVHGLVTPNTNAIINQLQTQTLLYSDATEQNPYGLVLIPASKGNLVQGNFLATNWNNQNGKPGQGKTILQITPEGVATSFATIPNNHKVLKFCGKDGIGLNMALAYWPSQGIVIAGATPIALHNNPKQIASPGCLIVLDSQGNFLDAHPADVKMTDGKKTGGGPWGATLVDNGNSASLFVSYVLGTNRGAMAPLKGPHGGKVVRYTLSAGQPPRLSMPTLVAGGFMTQPGGIAGGTVGPAGLVVAPPSQGASPVLYIADTMGSTIQAVPNPTTCTFKGCKHMMVASGGVLNLPIGITMSPLGTIVGANGGNGLIFEVSAAIGSNTQLAAQLVDNGGSGGAGDLFNVLFLNSTTAVFNDDAMNAFLTLTPTTCAIGR